MQLDVIKKFASSVEAYEMGAHLQKQVAELLAKEFHGLDIPAGDIIEVGCGTGFLSHWLLKEFGAKRCILSDASASALSLCQDKFGAKPSYTLLDGEKLEGSYSLIASSMTIQWFEDLHETLQKWISCLKPGGYCLLSFPEKIEAEGFEISSIINKLPSLEGARHVFKETYSHPLEWLKAMREIGVNGSLGKKTPLLSIKKLIKEWGMSLNGDFTINTTITIAVIRRS